jgi:hypothetical protein
MTCQAFFDNRGIEGALEKVGVLCYSKAPDVDGTSFIIVIICYFYSYRHYPIPLKDRRHSVDAVARRPGGGSGEPHRPPRRTKAAQLLNSARILLDNKRIIISLISNR